jgi:hypothetical protein
MEVPFQVVAYRFEILAFLVFATTKPTEPHCFHALDAIASPFMDLSFCTESFGLALHYTEGM